MDYKQLQSFVEVIKQKSFSAAAEKLKISQPTISTHVKNLEEELNAKLLIRTARTMELTPMGKEVYECSEHILKLWNEMQDRWNGEGTKLIHLGASTIPSAYILPEILPFFGEKYPEILFEVNQGDSQEIIQAVCKGIYDVGLVGMKTEEDSLKFEEFYEDRLLIITPVKEKYISMKKEQCEFSREQLLKESFILREDGSGSKKNAAEILIKMGIMENDLRVTARVNDQETIKNLVSAGLGISVVSEKAVKDYVQTGKLLAFDFPEKWSGRQLYVIYQKDSKLRADIRWFIDYLHQFYRGEVLETMES